MTETIKQNRLLLSLIVLVTVGVLVFNVFQYSASYGIVEINNINSLFLVPFIALVCWFGMALGSIKNLEKIEEVYQNQLTVREREVADLIGLGKKNREISDELYIDISTVKSHINRIYKKTGFKNRKELKYYLNGALEKDGIR